MRLFKRNPGVKEIDSTTHVRAVLTAPELDRIAAKGSVGETRSVLKEGDGQADIPFRRVGGLHPSVQKRLVSHLGESVLSRISRYEKAYAVIAGLSALLTVGSGVKTILDMPQAATEIARTRLIDEISSTRFTHMSDLTRSLEVDVIDQSGSREGAAEITCVFNYSTVSPGSFEMRQTGSSVEQIRVESEITLFGDTGPYVPSTPHVWGERSTISDGRAVNYFAYFHYIDSYSSPGYIYHTRQSPIESLETPPIQRGLGYTLLFAALGLASIIAIRKKKESFVKGVRVMVDDLKTDSAVTTSEAREDLEALEVRIGPRRRRALVLTAEKEMESIPEIFGQERSNA